MYLCSHKNLNLCFHKQTQLQLAQKCRLSSHLRGSFVFVLLMFGSFFLLIPMTTTTTMLSAALFLWSCLACPKHIFLSMSISRFNYHLFYFFTSSPRFILHISPASKYAQYESSAHGNGYPRRETKIEVLTLFTNEG